MGPVDILTVYPCIRALAGNISIPITITLVPETPDGSQIVALPYRNGSQDRIQATNTNRHYHHAPEPGLRMGVATPTWPRRRKKDGYTGYFDSDERTAGDVKDNTYACKASPSKRMRGRGPIWNTSELPK